MNAKTAIKSASRGSSLRDMLSHIQENEERQCRCQCEGPCNCALTMCKEMGNKHRVLMACWEAGQDACAGDGAVLR